MIDGLRPRIAAVVARQELRVTLRNRWVTAYTLVFAALTFAVSYFGLTVIQLTGFQGFERTAVSLVNLILYIVPLGTMLMAVQSFRPEGGTTDQLFAEPVSFGEIVSGKIVGLAVAHLIATALGFSFTGLLIAIKVGTAGMGSYLFLFGFTILIGFAFVSVSSLLTVLCRREVRAYAVVLVAWFVSVLLFDLLIIGLSFLLSESWASRTAFAAVFLNPVDAARVGALLSISGRELFGPAGALLVRALGGTVEAVCLLVGTLILWIVVPGSLAAIVLRRQDL